MDSPTCRSKSYTPKSDEDCSFEIIKRSWSFDSTLLEEFTEEEKEMDSTVSTDYTKIETLLHSPEEENEIDSTVSTDSSTKTETLLNSAEEDENALIDLASPLYSVPNNSAEQPSDDDDKGVIENCIKISKQCLAFLRQERVLLNLMHMAFAIQINQKSNSVVSKDSQNDKKEVKDDQENSNSVVSNNDQNDKEDVKDDQANSNSVVCKEEAKTPSSDVDVQHKPESQLSSYRKIFESKLSEMYPKIVLAVLIGFIVSFLLFLTYTVQFESMKMKQIQTYDNLTKEERQEKEKHRTETDDWRDNLVDKSYKDIRHYSDEHKTCLKWNQALKAALNSAEDKLYQMQLASEVSESAAKARIETWRSLTYGFKARYQNLVEQNAANKKARVTFDCYVLFVFLVILLAVIFLKVSKQF